MGCRGRCNFISIAGVAVYNIRDPDECVYDLRFDLIVLKMILDCCSCLRLKGVIVIIERSRNEHGFVYSFHTIRQFARRPVTWSIQHFCEISCRIITSTRWVRRNNRTGGCIKVLYVQFDCSFDQAKLT